LHRVKVATAPALKGEGIPLIDFMLKKISNFWSNLVLPWLNVIIPSMRRIPGRILFFIIFIFLVASAFWIVFDESRVIREPANFLQGVLVSSTTLLALTGVFLTSRVFSDEVITNDRISRRSRDMLVISMVFGLITIILALGCFTGWYYDPVLNPNIMAPKFTMVIFFFQFFLVYWALTARFIRR